MLLSLEALSVRFRPPPVSRPPSSWVQRLLAVPRPHPLSITVLNQLDLQVEPHDFLAIVGPSGSGKTTLLRAIAGLTPLDAGRIVLNGREIGREPPHRRDLALVFQNGGWYDHLSVAQHFQLDGLSAVEQAHLLEQIGLTEFSRHRPVELSGGQAQRLSIGRAIARKKPLILLDEPFNQLDQPIRQSLRQLLHTLRTDDRAFLYVTHDQSDAMLLANKFALLHNGRIQQLGPLDALYRTPNHRRVAEMIGEPKMQFFAASLSSETFRTLQAESLKSPGELSSHALAVIQRALVTTIFEGDTPHAVDVGVRANAWRIFPTDEPAMISSPGAELKWEANFVEGRFMGDRQLLRFVVPHSNLPPIEVVDRLPSALPALICGQRYSLCVPSTDLHLFSSETGHRLSSGLLTPANDDGHRNQK